MQRPRIIEIEGFSKEDGLMGLSQHDQIRLYPIQFRPSIVPKFGGHFFCDITTKTIEVKLTNPIFQHLYHIPAQLRVLVIKSRNITPVVGIGNLTGSVMLVKRRAVHQYIVPGCMIRHDIYDQLHSAPMRFGNQTVQVLLAAVIRVDAIVIAHCVRAADRSFLLFLTNWMDGHQPENVYTEFFQLVEMSGDAVEITRNCERSRMDLVNNSTTHPV